MDKVLEAYENFILKNIQAADESQTEETSCDPKVLNEMVKTYGDLIIKNRANELKEEELKVRREEIRLAEANHLIGTVSETGAKIHNTNTAVRLTNGLLEFEKDGNLLASSISRTIPGIISGMVKR